LKYWDKVKFMAEEILPVKVKPSLAITLVSLAVIVLLAIFIGRLFLSGDKSVPAGDLSQEYAKKLAQLEQNYRGLMDTSTSTKARVDALEKSIAVLQSGQNLPKGSCDTAQLIVRSNVADDMVSVDGKSMGRSGQTPYSVCAGTINVKVNKAGYLDFEQSISLAVGETKTVNARLVRAR
jgi:PEGA domain